MTILDEQLSNNYNIQFSTVDWLVGFNGISTFVSY